MKLLKNLTIVLGVGVAILLVSSNANAQSGYCYDGSKEDSNVIFKMGRTSSGCQALHLFVPKAEVKDFLRKKMTAHYLNELSPLFLELAGNNQTFMNTSTQTSVWLFYKEVERSIEGRMSGWINQIQNTDEYNLYSFMQISYPPEDWFSQFDISHKRRLHNRCPEPIVTSQTTVYPVFLESDINNSMGLYWCDPNFE